MSDPAGGDLQTGERCYRRHQRFGWTSLLVFLAMGTILETLHGFKVPFYLHAGNDTRRLLWTLAHAHGALFALIHLAAAAVMRERVGGSPALARLASPLLIAGSVLLPAGFFLGGAWIYDGDPGLGVFLVPFGALAMLVGVGMMARAAWTGGRS